MRRDLLRRLERREARQPPLQVSGLFWPNETVDPRALAPNERIVEDWYLDSDNGVRWTIERITTDPSDQGWNYRDPQGQVVDLNIQREILVVKNARYYSALSITHADVSIDSKKAV
jgi:hypothetical protein